MTEKQVGTFDIMKKLSEDYYNSLSDEEIGLKKYKFEKKEEKND